MELLLLALVLLVAMVLPLRVQNTGTHNTGRPVREILARLEREGSRPTFWFEGVHHAA